MRACACVGAHLCGVGDGSATGGDAAAEQAHLVQRGRLGDLGHADLCKGGTERWEKLLSAICSQRCVVES